MDMYQADKKLRCPYCDKIIKLKLEKPRKIIKKKSTKIVETVMIVIGWGVIAFGVFAMGRLIDIW